MDVRTKEWTKDKETKDDEEDKEIEEMMMMKEKRWRKGRQRQGSRRSVSSSSSSSSIRLLLNRRAELLSAAARRRRERCFRDLKFSNWSRRSNRSATCRVPRDLTSPRHSASPKHRCCAIQFFTERLQPSNIYTFKGSTIYMWAYIHPTT